MKILLVLFFLVLGKSAFSQSTFESKQHYRIINLSSSNDSIRIKKACDRFTNYDKFRFFDSRRKIQIKNTEVFIELFSAQELLDLYQKKISRFTIPDGVEYEKIEFELTDSKTLVFQVNKL